MKKTNKKLLLALGTLTTVAAPVAAVVSCGTDKNPGTTPGVSDGVRHFGLLPTYTGQADQLIALGIHSDYYPEQLNVQSPYDYLTSPGQYMTQQTDDFKSKFTKAIDGLMPKTKGVSWWNQDAKNSDDNRISNTYWQKQEGSVLLYEHYLLDDDQKVITSAWSPKHQPQTAVQTNFRASRDPYTRIPKGVFFGWDLSNKTLEEIATSGKSTSPTLLPKNHDEKAYIATEAGSDSATATAGDFTATLDGVVTSTLNGASVEITQDSAKIIIAMRKKRAELLNDKKGESDWFYNDWFFVDSFHRTYLDNADFQSSKFAQWMLDSTEDNPFEAVAASGHDLKAEQEQIKELFDASTFQGDEVKAGLDPSSRAKSAHHPIYEQQEGEVGAAPMFEGAMRDNQLYLFNVAWQVSNLAKTGTPYGEQFVNSLPQHTPDGASKNAADFSVARSQDEAAAVQKYVASKVTATQLTEMKNALTNANSITGELHTRMESMNDYFKALGVNGKTFGLMTIAPGHGVSTLQTTSKFSFIYRELGFAQPTPENLPTLAASAKKMTAAWQDDGTNPYLKDGKIDKDSSADGAAGVNEAIGANSLFNMDDNGWFWTLGESGSLSGDRLDKFKGSIDLGVIASRPENFKAEVTSNAGIQKHLAGMFKTYDAAADADGSKFVAKLREHANYDLWNEGLKTPFVMDMLLDQIMTKSEEYYVNDLMKNHSKSKAEAEAALNALQTSANGYDAAKSWGNYFTNTFVKDVK